MSEKKTSPRQSHNLTQEQLSNLKQLQVQGEQIIEVEANTEKGYMVKEHEQHLVHARIKTPQFNPQTGADEGAEVIQKFYPDEFKQMEKNSAFLGKKVTILHNPSGGKVASDGGGEQKPLTEKKIKSMSVKDLIAERERLVGGDGSSNNLDKKTLINDVLTGNGFEIVAE